MKIILCLLFSFSCYCCDVLFYVQDAGETNGLLPVAEALQKDGLDVVVLVGGVAEGKGKTVGAYGVVIDPKGARGVSFGKELALKVIDAEKPKVFISGVAFEWQGELYDACHERGIPTVAFWDNFNAEGTDPYFQMAHQVQARADRLWVPSHNVARHFSEREGLFVSGQPSLEIWSREAAKVNRAEIRKNLGLSGPVAVFIGGYGSEYETAFELFLSFLVEIDDLSVVIQPHPKFGGKIEEAILKRFGHLPVRILQGEITTIQAVAMADLVVCHQSTVGFQAEYLKKKVIRIPSVVTNVEQFKEVMRRRGSEIDLEIPSNSIESCAQYIKGMIL